MTSNVDRPTDADLIAEARKLDAKYGGHWQVEYEHGAALPSVVCNAEWPHAGKIIISRHVEPELADFIRSLPERVLQLADALKAVTAKYNDACNAHSDLSYRWAAAEASVRRLALRHDDKLCDSDIDRGQLCHYCTECSGRWSHWGEADHAPNCPARPMA